MEQWAVFIFHRDCRLEDHPGLNAACQTGLPILPVFIFDPAQLKQHPYRSLNGLQFLCDSVRDLQLSLQKNNGQLLILKGSTQAMVEQLIQSGRIAWFGSSGDVTPFATARDRDLKNLCQKHHIPFEVSNSLFLHHPKDVHKDDGLPYTVFTPFFRKASSLNQRQRVKPVHGPWASVESSFLKSHRIELEQVRPPEKSNLQKGGRTQALKLLKQLPEAKIYVNERDLPALSSTTTLAPHLKFGTVSPWETLEALGKMQQDHPIIRQLFWRDFFSHIAYHFPRVFTENFQLKTQAIIWPNAEEKFTAWCEGKTGYPIVDAAMRELVYTGNMHNRCRMITASFLVKDLHIDWRWGERFFAQHLTDYDPAINNGNWQWAASTGCDAQPYFRIFNPWLQQKKFDADAVYIKKWLPECAKAEARVIHELEKSLTIPSYYPQIVQHQASCLIAKSLFTTA
jgi:deoxyribodipyrimidine photo-lyase